MVLVPVQTVRQVHSLHVQYQHLGVLTIRQAITILLQQLTTEHVHIQHVQTVQQVHTLYVPYHVQIQTDHIIIHGAKREDITSRRIHVSVIVRVIANTHGMGQRA